LSALNLQGELDGLCGMYAVVNAFARIGGRRLSVANHRDIFHLMAKRLAKEGNFADMLVEGMRFRSLGKIIDVASEYVENACGVKVHRRISCKTNPSTLDEFWQMLSDHISAQDGRSVILGLSGVRAHWTCVGSMTHNQMRLIDSVGLKNIPRSRTTIGIPTEKRHHVLAPTQTYLLERI
jgi:hypothetical protein